MSVSKTVFIHSAADREPHRNEDARLNESCWRKHVKPYQTTAFQDTRCSCCALLRWFYTIRPCAGALPPRLTLSSLSNSPPQAGVRLGFDTKHSCWSSNDKQAKSIYFLFFPPLQLRCILVISSHRIKMTKIYLFKNSKYLRERCFRFIKYSPISIGIKTRERRLI